MDYKKTAEEILKYSGGKENIVSAAHCATRLRLVIAENEKSDKAALENIDGVKGVFFSSGQLQIIIGTGAVNKVYDEFVKSAGIETATKEDVKQAAASKANPVQRFIKTMGDIFVPIIPAIVACGVIMGLLEAVKAIVSPETLAALQQNAFFVVLNLMSSAAFTFLPILIGYSAAKTFGGNPFLGAVLGMFMIHPDLQNAWTVSEGINSYAHIFSYQIPMVGYQGHVIPVMIAAFIMSKLEIKLHKIVPEMIDLFVTPLVALMVTAILTFTIVGPIFSTAETWVLEGVQYLITLPFGIGAFIIGGIYAITVVAGIHHMYTIIDVAQLGMYGYTYWLPIASAANVAQAGACLAVALRTKIGKTKSVAYPAALSAALGITEPAIFGVNLRSLRPFIAGLCGGAAGALYASLMHLGATGTGVTGLFGFLLHLHAPIQYLFLLLISGGVGFAVSFITYKDPSVK